jgi:hypothetical protein
MYAPLRHEPLGTLQHSPDTSNVLRCSSDARRGTLAQKHHADRIADSFLTGC